MGQNYCFGCFSYLCRHVTQRKETFDGVQIPSSQKEIPRTAKVGEGNPSTIRRKRQGDEEATRGPIEAKIGEEKIREHVRNVFRRNA